MDDGWVMTQLLFVRVLSSIAMGTDVFVITFAAVITLVSYHPSVAYHFTDGESFDDSDNLFYVSKCM